MAENTHAAAIKWITSYDTGASSETIWAHMMGSLPEHAHYPYDPDDLGRCLRLLRAVPEWRERIPEMARYGAEWTRLAAHWDSLASLMDEEVGIDWSKGRRAERTYTAMKRVLDGPAPTPEPAR